MRSYLFCLATLLIASFPVRGEEIKEVVIPQQEVIEWNNVDLKTLDTVRKDLSNSCKKKINTDCSGESLSTFLSTDRSVIYYKFQLESVDVFVVYSVSAEKDSKKIGKSWVSAWQDPFLKILPFTRK